MFSISSYIVLALCLFCPVVNPLGQTNPQIMTEKVEQNALDGSNDALLVLYPNGGERVSGNVTVSWLLGSSFYISIVYFLVEYSPDDGLTWIPLTKYMEETFFVWNTFLYSGFSSESLLKVTASSKDWAEMTDFSDKAFTVDNRVSGSQDSPIKNSVPLVFSGFVAVGGTFLLLWLYQRQRSKKNRALATTGHRTQELLLLLRQRLLLGLDNNTDRFLELENHTHPLFRLKLAPPSSHYPETNIQQAKNQSVLDVMSIEFQDDFLSEIKGKTVLILVEIAYLDKRRANATNLSKTLQIPIPTLSRELKKLSQLRYVQPFHSEETLRDSRVRCYQITSKGYQFLTHLNHLLKITIKELDSTVII